MKRDARLLPIVISLGLLFGQPALAADSDVLAVVNGKKITEAEFNRYASQGNGHQAKREEALQELVNIELIHADGINKKLDKDAEFVAAMESVKKNQLASYTARKVIATTKPPTAAEIKAEYARILSEMPKYEYSASNIMVANENAAREILTALAGGAKFDDLAREKSIDDAGKAGGGLGWFTADQMEPAFADAVAALKQGEHTKNPVHTSFGWHIIKLDDRRDLALPPLAQVEEQIRNSLITQQFHDYIKALRAKAKIEIKQK